MLENRFHQSAQQGSKTWIFFSFTSSVFNIRSANIANTGLYTSTSCHSDSVLSQHDLTAYSDSLLDVTPAATVTVLSQHDSDNLRDVTPAATVILCCHNTTRTAYLTSHQLPQWFCAVTTRLGQPTWRHTSCHSDSVLSQHDSDNLRDVTSTCLHQHPGHHLVLSLQLVHVALGEVTNTDQHAMRVELTNSAHLKHECFSNANTCS